MERFALTRSSDTQAYSVAARYSPGSCLHASALAASSDAARENPAANWWAAWSIRSSALIDAHTGGALVGAADAVALAAVTTGAASLSWMFSCRQRWWTARRYGA